MIMLCNYDEVIQRKKHLEGMDINDLDFMQITFVELP